MRFNQCLSLKDCSCDAIPNAIYLLPFMIFLIITARKRSLGQGNIFLVVCQEFCSQGGCLLRGGDWSEGCMFWGGSALGGGAPGPGGPGGDPPQTATAAGSTHPTGMHSCTYNYSWST